MRWNTVKRLAVVAASWMVCTPVVPVLITATPLPSKHTRSLGQ